jgi:hypothetical protein
VNADCAAERAGHARRPGWGRRYGAGQQDLTAESAPAPPRGAGRLTRLLTGGPLGALTPVITVAFLAGLVLPVWWLVSAHHGGVPGLGAFPSAYLGDTVLLPLGCVMTAAGISNLPPAPRERTVGLVSAAVAAAVSVGIQADWLRDPSTQPNWTLPHEGELDAAGWWHAAYFTGMSVLLVTLTMVFLARVRAGRLAGNPAVREVSSGTGAALLLAGWLGYTALAVHDDLSGPLASSAVSVLVVVAVVLLIAGTAIGVAYGRMASVLIRPVLVAAGCAAAVTAFAVAPLAVQGALSIPLAAVACTIAGVAHSRRSRRRS